MKGSSSTIRKAVSLYDSLMIKEMETNEDIIKFLSKNSKPEKQELTKPILQYLFIEGETTKEMANIYAKKLFSQFESKTEKWKMPKIRNFSKYDIKLFRAENKNKDDDNEIIEALDERKENNFSLS